jgi:hypothetical protein
MLHYTVKALYIQTLSRFSEEWFSLAYPMAIPSVRDESHKRTSSQPSRNRACTCQQFATRIHMQASDDDCSTYLYIRVHKQTCIPATNARTTSKLGLAFHQVPTCVSLSAYLSLA